MKRFIVLFGIILLLAYGIIYLPPVRSYAIGPFTEGITCHTFLHGILVVFAQDYLLTLLRFLTEPVLLQQDPSQAAQWFKYDSGQLGLDKNPEQASFWHARMRQRFF